MTRRLQLLTMVLPLVGGGCSALQSPVDWYHGLEGGRIADQRPAPPNDDARYPNLSAVPARPVNSDMNTRNAVVNGLVADRANAQYAAALNPLPPPQTPPPRPVPPAARPSGDEVAGATLHSAAAPQRVGPLGVPQPNLPPVIPTPAKRAPSPKVEASALPPPAVPARGSVDRPVGDSRAAEPIATLPPVPAAPPPPPLLSGTPQVTAPAPSPTASLPAPQPLPVISAPGAPVLVAFPAGSAALPVEALGALKILSRSHGDRSIAVTGYGDAAGSDAKSQSAALPLALNRARAVAGNLLAAGVPSSQLRIYGEAQGHGASAQVAN